MARLYLIEFLHQTTTRDSVLCCTIWLYLIEFLHQTTTCDDDILCSCMLYLIEFLHQTTTGGPREPRRVRCILLNFYIKPQRKLAAAAQILVVSY